MCIMMNDALIMYELTDEIHKNKEERFTGLPVPFSVEDEFKKWWKEYKKENNIDRKYPYDVELDIFVKKYNDSIDNPEVE